MHIKDDDWYVVGFINNGVVGSTRESAVPVRLGKALEIQADTMWNHKPIIFRLVPVMSEKELKTRAKDTVKFLKRLKEFEEAASKVCLTVCSGKDIRDAGKA